MVSLEEQGMRRSRSRQRTEFPAKLDMRLVAYVTAATASGIGLMAFTQTAEAKIIYTPANTQVFGRDVPLDLNNDGIPDFKFNSGSEGHSFWLDLLPAVAGNGVKWKGTANSAAAMAFGQPVGPNASFNTSASYGAFLVGGFNTGGSSGSGGPFANTTNRYLGLRFSINGQTHYGWARISAKLAGTGAIGVVMTGYAYETTPNKTILVGHLHPAHIGSVKPVAHVGATKQPATLGLLAQGVRGLAIWRREEEAVAS